MQKGIKQEWIDILENLPEESEILDYKVKFYDLQVEGKKNKDAVINFAIDVNALMNSPREGNAYLVIGISDDKEIKGIDKDVDESYAKTCLYNCISTNSNISINNFSYNEFRLCIVEIELPSAGIPSYFSKDENKYNKVIHKNSYYSRRGSSNISISEMTNQEREKLTEWLTENKKIDQSAERFIDECIILGTKHQYDIVESVIAKFEKNKDEAEALFIKRQSEINTYRREANYPSSEGNNSEKNYKLLKKHGISVDLMHSLEQEYYINIPDYDYDNGGCLKTLLVIFIAIILLFAVPFLIYKELGRREREACASSACSSLKLQNNYYDFKREYIKSKCDCDEILITSLNKHIDKLLINNNCEEARSLIIEERDRLDMIEFNYKLEISLEKDSTLTEEQKKIKLDQLRKKAM